MRIGMRCPVFTEDCPKNGAASAGFRQIAVHDRLGIMSMDHS
jgi:hypothetical protein